MIDRRTGRQQSAASQYPSESLSDIMLGEDFLRRMAIYSKVRLMRCFVVAVVLCSLGCSKAQTPNPTSNKIEGNPKAAAADKAKSEVAPTEPIEQKLVRESLEKRHVGDPINWLQWWPVIDTEKAGLSAFIADQAESERERTPTVGDVMNDLMAKPTQKNPVKVLPDKMLRVRYRVANKAGLAELHDEVHFFSKDKYEWAFARPLHDKDAPFRSFAWKAFP